MILIDKFYHKKSIYYQRLFFMLTFFMHIWEKNLMVNIMIL